MDNYIVLIKDIIKTVKKAYGIAKERDFTIQKKSTNEDIVTSADIEVQNYLCTELKKLLPSSGFLCEENHLFDNNYDYTWVIDPIDGTTNFSRGISDYVISVALLYNNMPIAGVVYAPLKNYLFSAVAGHGAKLNGKRIHTSNKTFNNALFCTALSLYRKEYAEVCRDIIFETYNKCNDFRRFGSCALELCYIAAGKCDLYFEIRVFPWDYAASYLILKEAGGILKGLNGETLSFNKPTALVGANNVENYKMLNAIVNKYLTKLPYTESI
ncbi:MAG: inositol monophosphatase [Clostridia bacterium]|nr:inositol monophosphatase [Clostridia bacterium]